MNVNECKYLLLNLKFETFMLWVFSVRVHELHFLILLLSIILKSIITFFFKVMTLKKYKQILKSLFLILDE